MQFYVVLPSRNISYGLFLSLTCVASIVFYLCPDFRIKLLYPDGSYYYDNSQLRMEYYWLKLSIKSPKRINGSYQICSL